MTSTSLASKYVRSLIESIIRLDKYIEKGRLDSKMLGRPGPATLTDEHDDVTSVEEEARWITGREVAGVA